MAPKPQTLPQTLAKKRAKRACVFKGLDGDISLSRLKSVSRPIAFSPRVPPLLRMPSCLPDLPLLCEWTARCYIRVTIRHATLQTIKTIATGGLAIVDDDGMSVRKCLFLHQKYSHPRNRRRG